MKRTIILLGLIVLFYHLTILISFPVYAIDRNLFHQSAYWFATGGSRVAEIGDSDTVYLNPAGTVFLEDGVFIDFTVTIFCPYIEFENETYGKYVGDTLTPIPTFAVVRKKNKFAYFLTFTTPGVTAGGKFDKHPMLDFLGGSTNPNIEVTNQEFNGGSGMLGPSIGAAYMITDKWSVSYALGYLFWVDMLDVSYDVVNMSDNTITHETGKLDALGTGFCHTFSVDYKPIESLNFSMRYQSQVDFKGETKVDESTTIEYLQMAANPDAKEVLPAVFQIGTSYQMMDNLKLAASFGYIFEGGLDYGKFPDKMDDTFEDCQDYNIGLTYSLFNYKLDLMTGFRYGTERGDRTVIYGNWLPDFWALSVGAAYRPNFLNGGAFVFGWMRFFFEDVETKGDPVAMGDEFTITNTSDAIGITVDWRI